MIGVPSSPPGLAKVPFRGYLCVSLSTVDKGDVLMGRIVTAYYRAFGQLSDPKTRSVVWTSIALSVAIFVALYVALYLALKLTTFITIGPLEMLFDVIAQAGVMVLTWFLFPAVVTSVGSLLLDKVVDAVEERHYPSRSPAPGVTFKEGIGPALKFLGVTVGLNLLCLPLLLTPLFPFVYYGLNGYLLSREYFELVALRRLTLYDAQAMRIRWRVPLYMAGVGFAFMLTVPILNLLAPIIATAATVHLFEAWRSKDNVAEKPLRQDKVLHAAKSDVIVAPDLSGDDTSPTKT